MATVAYRNLWRATRVAFQGKRRPQTTSKQCAKHYANGTPPKPGDLPTLLAAQGQIRQEFRSKQSLDPNDAKATESIQHANEVAQFLRQNIVQGQRMGGEQNTYRTYPSAIIPLQ